MTKAELQSTAERLLKNLKRAGKQTPARENLEKAFGKTNKLELNSPAKVAAAKAFVNAKTSTAAGYNRVRREKAENFKTQLLNQAENLRFDKQRREAYKDKLLNLSQKEKEKLAKELKIGKGESIDDAIKNMKASELEEHLKKTFRETIEGMTTKQIEDIAEMYGDIFSNYTLDSKQEFMAVNLRLFDKISAAKSNNTKSLAATLTSRRAIEKEQKAILDAQMNNQNIAYKEHQELARMIREAAGG